MGPSTRVLVIVTVLLSPFSVDDVASPLSGDELDVQSIPGSVSVIVQLTPVGITSSVWSKPAPLTSRVPEYAPLAQVQLKWNVVGAPATSPLITLCTRMCPSTRSFVIVTVLSSPSVIAEMTPPSAGSELSGVQPAGGVSSVMVQGVPVGITSSVLEDPSPVTYSFVVKEIDGQETSNVKVWSAPAIGPSSTLVTVTWPRSRVS